MTTQLSAPPAAPPWRRLSARMLLVHPVSEVGKALPAILGALLAGHSSGNDASGWRWSLGITAVVAILSVLRWFTTRYRISAEQIQLREGLLRRRTRSAPLDRVRSVDVSAHLLHRALGLARVAIGTGTSDRKGRSGIVLNGLDADAAAQLREELLHRSPVSSVPETVDRPITAPVEQELVRLDPSWVRFAPFTLSGAVTGLALLGIAWRVVTEGHVDLHKLGPYESAATRLQHWPLAVDIALVTVGVLVFVAVASTVGYLLAFWDFRLTRHPGGTLHVARGLLTTRATSIEHARLRGAELSEPLLLRAVGGARCLVIATGLRVGRGADRGGEILLPPAPREVARRVAGTVIERPAPFCAALAPHPRAALRRRLLRAVMAVALLAVALAVLAALASWSWWLLLVPAALSPCAVLLGLDRYRGLGHVLVEGYLVTRFGSLVRRRCAVSTDGIVGWTVRSSWFQRRVGLVTLIATTAAGKQHYPVMDLDPAAAVALAENCLPGLLTQFRA